jgi:thymidine phosphorylase
MADHTLRARRLGIDTHQEAILYVRRDCPVCRSAGFEAETRVAVRAGERSIIATLNVVSGDLLAPGEAGLSEAAWARLGAAEAAELVLAHPAPLESLSLVRGKVYGRPLDEHALRTIVRDVVAGRYSDIHLASFITACAARRLSRAEMVGLTRAMIETGERVAWGSAPVVDKHSVGGLPGNRTTLIVVPIVAAFGLLMPKTSSRAITSPAGTADTMETLAPVDLDATAIRRVVEREGACIVWGGALGLSPADDILIRVERPLELDTAGQLVASIISKKVAAGSSHVVIDIPVGETAKIRDPAAAGSLSKELVAVGRAVGLHVEPVATDGVQPVGRGIGPALEARDVLAVLQCEPGAPADLRARSLLLAGHVLELSPDVPRGQGTRLAQAILDDGRAWRKFQALCAAQGGMRQPPRAVHTHTVDGGRAGRVTRIDNRRLARAAKLAGAPSDPAAGLELHVPLGTRIERGQPLFTLHAESAGELAYALAFVRAHPDIIAIEEGPCAA